MARTVAGPASSEGMRNVATAIHSRQGGLEHRDPRGRGGQRTDADFDDFVEAFADQIDGLWASTLREVSILATVDAYELSAKKLRDLVIDTSGGGLAGRRLGVVLRGPHDGADWWANKRMPPTARNIARGIVRRMGRPRPRTASHPVWANLAIDDSHSGSGSGTRHFSLDVLCGSKVLIVQPAAYGLLEFKVA